MSFWGVSNGYTQTSESKPSSTTETKAEKIDRYHDLADEIILGTVNWADSFFGTDTYTAEANRTYLRTQLGGFIEEGEDLDVNLRFRFNLNLPRTEKRFRLTIASDPDAVDNPDDLQDDSSRDQVVEAEENTTVGLEYFYLDQIKYNLKFSGGALIRNETLVGFGSTRYRYLITYDPWSIRFVERLRWYTDEGWDARSEIDFERPFSDRLFFRTKPWLKWEETRNGFEYAVNTSLYHALNQKAAIEYQFNMFLDTEYVGQFKECNLRVRYRRQIWRPWLILEIAPQLAWYKSRDFKTVPGIQVQFEIWTGRYKSDINS